MSGKAKTRHVLVVEDDSDIRESVVEILADEGYDVSAAGDGRQALELLRSSAPRPDLILLDLMMPVMNGFQFREEQLKDPELARIPVLVVTADANARAKAEALGAAGFVQKPLKIQPLLDIIEELTG
jgi:CheY-like chemotaxis protein